jgi:DNA-binding Lrp family transcriptional regulator
MECYLTTGGADYLIRVAVPDMAALELPPVPRLRSRDADDTRQMFGTAQAGATSVRSRRNFPESCSLVYWSFGR